MGKERFLVYGTLKNGRREKILIKAAIRDCGSFPAVKLGREGIVECEVVEISTEKMTDNWDNYEGCPYLYTRERVKALNGEEYWIYEGNESWDDSRILSPDGDGVCRWRGRFNLYVQ